MDWWMDGWQIYDGQMAVKGNIDDVNVNADVIRTDLSGADPPDS